MIFDTQDQKDFIFKVMRSYVCPYGESLDISQKYAPAMQTGAVIGVAQQQKLVDEVFPPKKPVEVVPPARPVEKAVEPAEGSKNGKDGKKDKAAK